MCDLYDAATEASTEASVEKAVQRQWGAAGVKAEGTT